MREGTGTMQAPGAFADMTALRECWHPVAFARDLADKPRHADLLGQPLVLWRGPDGRPRANSDLCVHRGTALSLGWVSGDELVCPYHGWRYRADGRCAAVPELEDGSWALVPAGPYGWRCDAARQVENFTDFGHFPWVHPGLLGDPDRP